MKYYIIHPTDYSTYYLRKRSDNDYYEVYDPKDEIPSFVTVKDGKKGWKDIHITQPQRLIEITEEEFFLELV